MTDLGLLGYASDDSATATSLNDAGLVVGYNYHSLPGGHAFVFGPGGLQDLGMLIPDNPYTILRASGINRFGQIAATIDTNTSTGGVHVISQQAVLLSPTFNRALLEECRQWRQLEQL